MKFKIQNSRNKIDILGMKFFFIVFVFSSLLLPAGAQNRSDNEISGIPHLSRQGTATQLIVDGKPLLMLAGELGNSSSSNLEYMKPLWPKLVSMHLNTVLVPVYWELLEPQEGKFDFMLVDSIIFAARQNDLKVVFLWFGTWKNSMSCYVPLWIKKDQRQFPRARTKEGIAVEILTPFSDENRNADARAFAGLMKHIRTVDGINQTVIMVQVENEIGMIPDARDYCKEANKHFSEQVPSELMNYLKKNKQSLIPELYQLWEQTGFKSSGTWEEVFGKDLHTDEVFMAWYFAKYTNYVMETGKKEYPLPMYVNAALIRPGYKPGQYPSAGPLPHVMDVWRVAAPQIDFLAPDIYFKNFAEWVTKYDRSGNPLFIPETDQRQSVTNAFYAIAQHNAMGYSPFSIESVVDSANRQLVNGYNVLRQLAPLIVEHQGSQTMAGFLLDSASHAARIELGGYVFNVTHEFTWPYAPKGEGETPRVGGMIIMIAEDEFYIAGNGVVVRFESSSNDGTITGIASIDEGIFVNGKWIAGRRMNGDEDHQGRHLYLPGKEYSIQKVKLYKYK